MKTEFKYLLAGVAILGLSAGPALAEDTIKIGNITATSGFLKGAAEPSVVAIDIAVDEINAAGGINGKKVEIVRYDTGSDPKQAAVATRTLARDDKVLAILGPFSSGEAKVAINDAERLKLLMIPTASSAPGLTDGKRYAWRLTEDEGKQFSRLMAAMKEANIKMDTAAIVYVSEEVVANVLGTKLYPAILGAAGVEFGDPIPVQYKSFDLSAQVAKIVEMNPDVIAVAGLPESASKLIGELERGGYEGRVIGSQLFSDPDVVELFGPPGEGTLMMSGFWKGQNEGAKAFDAKYVEETKARGMAQAGAHHSDAQAYDAVFMLKQIMEAAGTTGAPDALETEREAIVDGMTGLTFSGILGDNICFNGNDAELPGYIIEIKDGAWTKFAEAAADACN